MAPEPTRIRPPRKSLLAAAWALVAALAGCAGPQLARAITVEPGRRLVVQLVQFVDGRVFTLQNESSGAAATVYSDTRSDGLTKVVGDPQLQTLLDTFAEEGLFAGASGSAPASARDALVITKDDRRYVLHAHTPSKEGPASYSRARAYFLAVYNQAVAYHTSDIDPRGLREEQERARYDGQQAVRDLQKKAQGRGQ